MSASNYVRGIVEGFEARGFVFELAAADLDITLPPGLDAMSDEDIVWFRCNKVDVIRFLRGRPREKKNCFAQSASH
jgi:hypothetical protein